MKGLYLKNKEPVRKKLKDFLFLQVLEHSKAFHSLIYFDHYLNFFWWYRIQVNFLGARGLSLPANVLLFKFYAHGAYGFN